MTQEPTSLNRLLRLSESKAFYQGVPVTDNRRRATPAIDEYPRKNEGLRMMKKSINRSTPRRSLSDMGIRHRETVLTLKDEPTASLRGREHHVKKNSPPTWPPQCLSRWDRPHPMNRGMAWGRQGSTSPTSWQGRYSRLRRRGRCSRLCAGSGYPWRRPPPGPQRKSSRP